LLSKRNFLPRLAEDQIFYYSIKERILNSGASVTKGWDILYEMSNFRLV